MGYGLSAALGAKLARPEAPVLAVLGDGGFSMNSQELETALRVGAQLVVLVLVDRSYSLIHHSQQNKGLPNYSVDFNPIDSVLTAQACGMEGLRIENAEDLADAVRAALVEERSLVVEVPIEIEAYSSLV
jgi:acetolactate synthase-1/2/3 large subunit